ncbi:hypothetical protein [Flavobacterium terrigena]|uniref:Uncharacterized protein n=1 Tax=Flavobacterium terrigena TaxID=402734 RepID=A0A1H6WMM3_9FLAO|nr:hypothetical protein [Flavobacterium terrigena]SEJ13712.1 hypothetical protein SAMN05660918_2498 [Flavobacterium terrigena]
MLIFFIIPLKGSFIFDSLVILFCGIVFLISFISKIKQRKEEKKVNNIIEKFKKSSKKIEINYTEIKIKSNSWKQEIEVGSGVNSRNDYIDVCQNDLSFSIEIGDIKYVGLVQIDMNTDILKMKLAYKNNIDFYYDLANPNQYILDLDFLIS